ncbi:hypothetical protein BDR03DRAFT_958004 [Suillus americanus]|nr:hypothetical protein BDR03DRAFT_958004 [Suillus americanus]
MHLECAEVCTIGEKHQFFFGILNFNVTAPNLTVMAAVHVHSSSTSRNFHICASQVSINPPVDPFYGH